MEAGRKMRGRGGVRRALFFFFQQSQASFFLSFCYAKLTILLHIYQTDMRAVTMRKKAKELISHNAKQFLQIYLSLYQNDKNMVFFLRFLTVKT